MHAKNRFFLNRFSHPLLTETVKRIRYTDVSKRVKKPFTYFNLLGKIKMNTIQPYLESHRSFQVYGFQVRTQNTDEFNPEIAKLPSLWQKFSTSDLAKEAAIFGVYSDYESDANGLYTVTAGVASTAIKAELSSITVHPGKYLVFKNHGPMPFAVIEAWKQVWHYFSTEPNYQRNFRSDFEAYLGSDEIAIHIGVD